MQEQESVIRQTAFSSRNQIEEIRQHQVNSNMFMAKHAAKYIERPEGTS